MVRVECGLYLLFYNWLNIIYFSIGTYLDSRSSISRLNNIKVLLPLPTAMKIYKEVLPKSHQNFNFFQDRKHTTNIICSTHRPAIPGSV